jgi:hypothetical protein
MRQGRPPRVWLAVTVHSANWADAISACIIIHSFESLQRRPTINRLCTWFCYAAAETG